MQEHLEQGDRRLYVQVHVVSWENGTAARLYSAPPRESPHM
jgi:hypothetical protein